MNRSWRITRRLAKETHVPVMEARQSLAFYFGDYDKAKLECLGYGQHEPTTFPDIAERFGITVSKARSLVRKYGWPFSPDIIRQCKLKDSWKIPVRNPDKVYYVMGKKGWQ